MNNKIGIGNLYDVNKELVLKENKINDKDYKTKLEEIRKFCIVKSNQYYMLLNRETYNFTLFNLGIRNMTVNANRVDIDRIIYNDLKECLDNRGTVVSIELTEDKNAYEIWIKANGEALVYYFFPYDQGVID